MITVAYRITAQVFVEGRGYVGGSVIKEGHTIERGGASFKVVKAHGYNLGVYSYDVKEAEG